MLAEWETALARLAAALTAEFLARADRRLLDLARKEAADHARRGSVYPVLLFREWLRTCPEAREWIDGVAAIQDALAAAGEPAQAAQAAEPAEAMSAEEAAYFESLRGG